MTSSESSKRPAASGANKREGFAWTGAAGVAALAGLSWGLWLFYTAAGGRERGLWFVFDSLILEWSVGEAGSLLFGAAWVASAVLTILAGVPILLLLRLRWIGRAEALALAYLFGLGAVGLIGEFLALAGWLEAGPLWGVSLFLILWVGPTLTRRWRLEGARRSDWAWLASRRDREEVQRRFDPASLPPDGEEPSVSFRLEGLSAAALNSLTALILLVCAYHALLFPVTYWDAMILYVGYARMMFEAGGVAEKIVGQVGIGLGANYPHLFEFYHIAVAKMAGLGWSTVYARGVSPLCAGASAILIGSTMRRLGFSRLASSGAALLSVATPLAVCYQQYASNYLLAVALTSAFLWGAAAFLRTRTWSALAVCFLAATLAVHVNYLMWALWLGGAVLMFVSLPLADSLRDDQPNEADDPFAHPEPGLESFRGAVGSGRFWLMFFAALALAMPWHVRNVIKTGNPVYAFFYEIFPSERVNPEVMESCRHEWVRNGAGIGFAALQYAQEREKLRLEQQRAENQAVSWSQARAAKESADHYTFRDKMLVTPWFFATGKNAYLIAPLFLGFGLPGMALWLASATGAAGVAGRRIRAFLGMLLALGGCWLLGTTAAPGLQAIPFFGDALSVEEPARSLFFPAVVLVALSLLAMASLSLSRLGGGESPKESLELNASFGVLCYFLTLFFLFYHYAVADFYLYQILPFLAPLAFFAATALELASRLGGLVRALLFGVLVSIGLVPGLAFALMGGKIVTARPEPGYPKNPQFELYALRHPLMEDLEFWELQYGPDTTKTWTHINENLPGVRLLTHENRHLAFEPGIELVHLDDWELQGLYDLPTPEEKLQGILDLGLEYYLDVPNEDAHPINKRLELDRWRGTPQMEVVFQPSPESATVLYRLRKN
jgi:hypothetical protein